MIRKPVVSFDGGFAPYGGMINLWDSQASVEGSGGDLRRWENLWLVCLHRCAGEQVVWGRE